MSDDTYEDDAEEVNGNLADDVDDDEVDGNRIDAAPAGDDDGDGGDLPA